MPEQLACPQCGFLFKNPKTELEYKVLCVPCGVIRSDGLREVLRQVQLKHFTLDEAARAIIAYKRFL